MKACFLYRIALYPVSIRKNVKYENMDNFFFILAYFNA